MPGRPRPPADPPTPSFLQWESKFPLLARLYRETRMGDPQNYFVRLLQVPLEVLEQTMALYEKGLERLAPDDFKKLVTKCKGAASQPTPDRRWEHFFSLLDETWGYALLKSEGYDPVHLIDARGGDSPEACGHRGEEVALLELKSVRESAEDREAMDPTSKDWKNKRVTGLDRLFYRIEALVNAEATRQLTYDKPCGPVARRIFLVLVSNWRLGVPSVSSESERLLRDWARRKYAGANPEVRVEFWRTFAISLTRAPAESAAVEDP